MPKKSPKRRSAPAKALAEPEHRQRIVPSKKRAARSELDDFDIYEPDDDEPELIFGAIIVLVALGISGAGLLYSFFHGLG